MQVPVSLMRHGYLPKTGVNKTLHSGPKLRGTIYGSLRSLYHKLHHAVWASELSVVCKEYMPRFKITLHCFNLDVPDEDSGKKIIGFYTTRYSYGESKEKAFEEVIRKLKTENVFKQLQILTKENKQTEPIFEIEEIEKVPFYSGLFFKGSGYTLYPDE